MTGADKNRKFVNATSFEEAIATILAIKADNFEDVVFGILQDSALHSTPLVKSLIKKLIDSGFTDTEQAIFTGAILASCIDSEEIKAWFAKDNIEFHSDIDDYSFIISGEKAPISDKKTSKS